MVFSFELFADFLGLENALVASFLQLEQFQLPFRHRLARRRAELDEVDDGASRAFGEQTESLGPLELSAGEHAVFELERDGLAERDLEGPVGVVG